MFFRSGHRINYLNVFSHFNEKLKYQHTIHYATNCINYQYYNNQYYTDKEYYIDKNINKTVIEISTFQQKFVNKSTIENE